MCGSYLELGRGRDGAALPVALGFGLSVYIDMLRCGARAAASGYLEE
jgi:hypothetical protein